MIVSWILWLIYIIQQKPKKSINQSNKFYCRRIVVDPRDYLSLYDGMLPYGRFDEERYRKYRRSTQAMTIQ